MPASCLILDPGIRAGLTCPVLAAVSLAEPDRRRQGQQGLEIFQLQAHFFACYSRPCEHLSPNGIWRSAFYTISALGMPQSVKINRGNFACRSLKLWYLPYKHPIHTVLHRQRELHWSKNITGTSDLRACKRIFLQKLKGWIVQPLQHWALTCTTSPLRKSGTEMFPASLWFQ